MVKVADLVEKHLAGTLSVVARPGLVTNSTFVIIDNDGTDSVSGTFAGLANNATFFQSGYTWRISYVGGDGNNVTLSIVSATKPVIEGQWSATTLTLSWPDWASAYSFYTTTNLASPAVWLPVTNAPVIGGGKLSIVLPTSVTSRQFFRLKWP